jgi:hypothetical protein
MVIILLAAFSSSNEIANSQTLFSYFKVFTQRFFEANQTISIFWA